MIGKKIAELRKNRGFTLSELAQRADVSKSYLSNIERNLNQNPSLLVMRKLSKVLNVDILTLLQSDENAEEDTLLEPEWISFVSELKRMGIKKEQLHLYSKLMLFIKWENEDHNF